MAANGKLAAQLRNLRDTVDVDHFDLIVREIVRMVADGELDCAPEYQRRFRWKEDDESRLVESLFLGLPVPALFVAANLDGTWELVDGLQRVSTLLHFCGGAQDLLSKVGKISPLKLSGLERLTEFNGVTFEELGTPEQLQFSKRSLRVTVLSDKSEHDTRYELFDRLNRGGVTLSDQEVRACVYRGQFAKLLRDLAERPTFDRLIKLKKDQLRDGTREEIVLRFFAFLNARDGFTGAVRAFLDSYMKAAAEAPRPGEGEALFDRTCEALLSVVDGPVLKAGYPSTPINLLEAVLVAAGGLVSGGQTLSPQQNWLNDRTLIKRLSKGTNTVRMLNGRIDRARELLLGAEPELG